MTRCHVSKERAGGALGRHRRGALLLASLMEVLLAFLEQGATRVIAALTAILFCYGGIAKVFQYRGPRQGKP